MFRFICGRGGAGESSVLPCQTKVPVPPKTNKNCPLCPVPGPRAGMPEKRSGNTAAMPYSLNTWICFIIFL